VPNYAAILAPAVKEKMKEFAAVLGNPVCIRGKIVYAALGATQEKSGIVVIHTEEQNV